MQKVKNLKDKEISINGKINNIDVDIKNKKINEVIQYLYNLFIKDSSKKIKLDNIDVTFMLKEDVLKGKKKFSLFGYAKKSGDNSNESQRQYFNIQHVKSEKIFVELEILYNSYLCDFYENKEDFEIIVEGFYIY